MVSLIESEREVISIASQSMNILSPNSTWLESNIDDMLVKSSAPQGLILQRLIPVVGLTVKMKMESVLKLVLN